MEISASHEGIRGLSAGTAGLAARTVEQATALDASSTRLPDGATGSPHLDTALNEFTSAWSTAFDRFAEDARTIVRALEAVDARYTRTELTVTRRFGDGRQPQ